MVLIRQEANRKSGLKPFILIVFLEIGADVERNLFRFSTLDTSQSLNGSNQLGGEPANRRRQRPRSRRSF